MNRKKDNKESRLFSRAFKWLKKLAFRGRVTGPLLSGALVLFLKALFRTYRVTVEGELPPGPKIAAFWHQRLFAMIDHFRLLPIKKGVVISSSVDGDFIASIAEGFGYAAIRKPRHSQNDGVRLTKEVISLLQNGGGLAVIPDGPKGPPGEAPAGLVKLAAICQAPVVPMGYSATFRWVFPSWDRFILPLPCSRVHIVRGKPISVTNGTPAQVEAKRLELQQGIDEATAAADRHLGQRCPLPARRRRNRDGRGRR